jgi:hypothetical protein
MHHNLHLIKNALGVDEMKELILIGIIRVAGSTLTFKSEFAIVVLI